MTQPMQPAKVLLYSPNLSGHRASFVLTTTALLDGQASDAKTIAMDERPALFLMIEDNFILFVILSFWRGLLGRVTVGFLFRPMPAVNGKTARLLIKRNLLRVLHCLTSVRVLTIFPIPMLPNVDSIADGWIYDLQLWDIGPLERDLATRLRSGVEVSGLAGEMLAKIKVMAGYRSVLVTLGLQTNAKGFPALGELAEMPAAENWLIVSLGRVSADQSSTKARLEELGHLVVDRFVSDDELIAAYAAADAVWCFYDPGYDQASGILGRAVQFGIAPIVRDGSLSHKLCISENIPHLSAKDADTCASALHRLPELQPDKGSILAAKFREASVASLIRHLSGSEPNV